MKGLGGSDLAGVPIGHYAIGRAAECLTRFVHLSSTLLEGDKLATLATLVSAYEEKRFPMDAPDPVSAIQFRMEQQGVTRTDLEPMIGNRARVSEVMTGKRPLTLAMVRRVKAGWGISADLLVGTGKSVTTGRRRG